MRLAFYKGSGNIIDKLIRWFCKGKYSHCELVFSDGIWFSADAWTNRTRFERVWANPANWDIVDVVMTPKEELSVRAFCDSQNGKKYDYMGILGFLLPFECDDPIRWFCSEICVEGLQQAGKLRGVKSHLVDPVQLGKMYGLS